eukprot:Gb_32139 [translate_table: standard]
MIDKLAFMHYLTVVSLQEDNVCQVKVVCYDLIPNWPYWCIAIFFYLYFCVDKSHNLNFTDEIVMPNSVVHRYKNLRSEFEMKPILDVKSTNHSGDIPTQEEKSKLEEAILELQNRLQRKADNESVDLISRLAHKNKDVTCLCPILDQLEKLKSEFKIQAKSPLQSSRRGSSGQESQVPADSDRLLKRHMVEYIYLLEFPACSFSPLFMLSCLLHVESDDLCQVPQGCWVEFQGYQIQRSVETNK